MALSDGDGSFQGEPTPLWFFRPGSKPDTYKEGSPGQWCASLELPMETGRVTGLTSAVRVMDTWRVTEDLRILDKKIVGG